MSDPEGRQVVLSPIGEPRPVEPAPGAGRRISGSLRGRRVAIVDNQIPGMAELAELLARTLGEPFGAAVSRWTVPHSLDVDPSVLAELAASSDVAILGLGNSGAATIWNCGLTAQLAPRLPVLNVVARRFEAVARSGLRARGYPQPALALVADTPDLLQPATLEQQARLVAHACAAQLTTAGADADA